MSHLSHKKYMIVFFQVHGICIFKPNDLLLFLVATGFQFSLEWISQQVATAILATASLAKKLN